MNQTESIRGMVTLLAVYRELIRALLAIDSADAGPLVDLVGLTGAALDDAARHLGAAEVRRIVAGARRGAAPHIAEIKADPPVKVADLKAERDALAARVAALEECARAAQEWRATWATLDDAAAAVARRQKARERLFTALDAGDMELLGKEPRL